ncbi:MAG: hypothetical protein IT423_08025 [Pirellulaceae bacterium]|nr:hypothetical protein [Pirellulaceae bacterium]
MSRIEHYQRLELNIMRTDKSNRCQRRAIASLELVMSFPVLVMLVAMLFTLGITTKTKSHVTMDVRHKAWAARTAPVNPRPFSLTQAHRAGQVENERAETNTMYQNLFPFIPRDIQWGNVVMTGSWDYRQVEFADGNWIPIYPHFGVLTQMATAQGGVDTPTGGIGPLSSLVGIPH